MVNPYGFVKENKERIGKTLNRYVKYSNLSEEDFIQESIILAYEVSCESEFWEKLQYKFSSLVVRTESIFTYEDVIESNNPESLLLSEEERKDEEKNAITVFLIFYTILDAIDKKMRNMTEKQREIWYFLFEFENRIADDGNKIENFLSFLQEKGVCKSRTAVYNLLNRSLTTNLQRKSQYEQEDKARKKRYPSMVPLFLEKEKKYA